MKPYTPFKMGVLENSATIHTVIGSGEIKQITPYARYLYYGKVYGPNYPIVREKDGTEHIVFGHYSGDGIIIGWRSPKGKKNTRQAEIFTTARTSTRLRAKCGLSE